MSVDPARVQTNIVIFDVSETGQTPARICARLSAEHGVLASPFGHTVRMVTHYDVSRADIERALEGVKAVVGSQ